MINRTIIKHEASADTSADTRRGGFVDAMADMPSFSDFQKQQSPRNKEYLQDRTQENLAMFNGLPRNTEHLKKYYSELVQDFPELGCVKLLDDPTQIHQAFSNLGDKTNPYPNVKFNFSHLDTYTRPTDETMSKLPEPERAHIESHTENLKLLALQLGANPKDFVQNEKLVSTFVFIHELGHSYDYLKNYLRATPDELRNGVSDDRINVAREESSRVRGEQGTQLPLPERVQGKVKKDGNLIKADYAKDAPRLNPKRFARRLEALGIDANDSEELASRQNKAYREMQREKYADTFATNFILKHYNDFFGNGENRIQTSINKVRKINEDEIRLLGIDSGAYASLTELNHDPKSFKNQSFSGFLTDNIRTGKGISVCKDGNRSNQNNENYDSIRGGTVESVYICPTPSSSNNQRQVKNRIMLRMYDGVSRRDFELTIDETKEPPKVDIKLEDLQDDLSIIAGSEIQLLKRNTKDDSPNVLEGDMLIGTISPPKFSWENNDQRPIQMQSKIYFDDGAETSDVMGAYKQWNTYHIKTWTSDYEVLPME